MKKKNKQIKKTGTHTQQKQQQRQQLHKLKNDEQKHGLMKGMWCGQKYLFSKQGSGRETCTPKIQNAFTFLTLGKLFIKGPTGLDWPEQSAMARGRRWPMLHRDNRTGWLGVKH